MNDLVYLEEIIKEKLDELKRMENKYNTNENIIDSKNKEYNIVKNNLIYTLKELLSIKDQLINNKYYK